MEGYERPEDCSVELEVNVLTTGYWPAASVPQCRLAPELMPVYDAFEAYYNKKNTGRKLAWRTDMGSADLKVRWAAAMTSAGSSGTRCGVHALTLPLLPRSVFPIPPSGEIQCEDAPRTERVDVSDVHSHALQLNGHGIAE